jgi:hypothetical protein
MELPWVVLAQAMHHIQAGRKKKHLFHLALYPLKGFSLHLERGE